MALERKLQLDQTIAGAGGGGTSVPTGTLLSGVYAAAPTGWILLTTASAIATVGNASSGADRANADTESLFTTIWDAMADAQAPVSGGRGASAAADFAANKTITIPDVRGRSILGTGQGGGLTDRVHGAVSGAETHQLSTGELANHLHGMPASGYARWTAGGTWATSGNLFLQGTQTGAAGGNGAHNNMQPWLALNIICKL